MKKIITSALLAAVILIGQSFTKNINKPIGGRNAPGYSLSIDAAPFDAAPNNNYTAKLTNGGRTVSLTFLGNAVKGNNGQLYPTKLEVDFTYKGDALGEVNVERVSYEYNNQKYHGMPGTAFISITKMKAAPDGKSFTLNADVFCKVQKNFIIEEFVPVLVITGGVQNITVVKSVL